MFRLALHWQILIGMVAGTVLGLGLNVFLGDRQTEVTEGLPSGVLSASIGDSSERTTINYTRDDATEVAHVIDPSGRGENVSGSIADLKSTDAVAAQIYLAHGQSHAKVIGSWFKRIGGLFLRMLQMVAVPLILTSLVTGILGLGGGGRHWQDVSHDTVLLRRDKLAGHHGRIDDGQPIHAWPADGRGRSTGCP